MRQGAQPPELGAHPVGDGVSFAVFSRNASGLEVCLFDESGAESRHTAERVESDVWHVVVKGATLGTPYGFRAEGPMDPAGGHRFDASKLLSDPYARRIDGEVLWDDALLMQGEDSAPFVPRCVVEQGSFDWSGDTRPETPWSETLIYEAHIKGLTALHPSVPAPERGTYLGLASEPVITHLRGLGVTAVQLLPVQQHIDDRPLVRAGLRNYWGYQPLGLFAPHNSYARTPRRQVSEFKTMVQTLHAAGIEVLLDVVFNHSCEGDESGPTMCMRGLDNSIYYRLDKVARRYVDDTGLGNTIDTNHPVVTRLILDCLRYWVEQMHVDGFRFDLATSLGRDPIGFRARAPIFGAILADPILREVKLIAEPWDLGSDGYQLGKFPRGFAELNGRFRDDVRDFIRGWGSVGNLATRLAGSSDTFGEDRGPLASINFISSHDGFTLRDLVSYERKHNLENLLGDTDGEDDNRSHNWGAEGDTDNETIQELRLSLIRNFLLLLACSQGVPMLLGGDELFRTQRGNNNAFCQDNVLSWIDWESSPRSQEILAFARRVFALRKSEPLLRRGRFLRLADDEPADVTWLDRSGEEIAGEIWQESDSLGMLLGGGGPGSLLLIVVGPRDVEFIVPQGRWHSILSSGERRGGSVERSLRVQAHESVLLKRNDANGG